MNTFKFFNTCNNSHLVFGFFFLFGSKMNIIKKNWCAFYLTIQISGLVYCFRITKEIIKNCDWIVLIVWHGPFNGNLFGWETKYRAPTQKRHTCKLWSRIIKPVIHTVCVRWACGTSQQQNPYDQIIIRHLSIQCDTDTTILIAWIKWQVNNRKTYVSGLYGVNGNIVRAKYITIVGIYLSHIFSDFDVFGHTKDRPTALLAQKRKCRHCFSSQKKTHFFLVILGNIYLRIDNEFN